MQQLVMEPVTREFADLLFLSYADNTYILGQRQGFWRRLACYGNGCKGWGWRCRPPSANSGYGRPLTRYRRCLWACSGRRRDSQWWGVPIGAKDWEVARLRERLRQQQTPLPWLPLLDHPQIASHLLAIAISARPMYLARTVPPRPEVVDAFSDWDSSLEDCFEQLFSSGTWEFDRARSTLARLQLHLPFRLGGFGIRASTSLRVSYACGWAQAARGIA
ncbi:unnamed protein product [Closterium sp. NIES-54]